MDLDDSRENEEAKKIDRSDKTDISQLWSSSNRISAGPVMLDTHLGISNCLNKRLMYEIFENLSEQRIQNVIVQYEHKLRGIISICTSSQHIR